MKKPEARMQLPQSTLMKRRSEKQNYQNNNKK